LEREAQESIEQERAMAAATLKEAAESIQVLQNDVNALRVDRKAEQAKEKAVKATDEQLEWESQKWNQEKCLLQQTVEELHKELRLEKQQRERARVQSEIENEQVEECVSQLEEQFSLLQVCAYFCLPVT